MLFILPEKGRSPFSPQLDYLRSQFSKEKYITHQQFSNGRLIPDFIGKLLLIFLFLFYFFFILRI